MNVIDDVFGGGVAVEQSEDLLDVRYQDSSHSNPVSIAPQNQASLLLDKIEKMINEDKRNGGG